jgi:transcriptional regulator with XRE-family HTH domain
VVPEVQAQQETVEVKKRRLRSAVRRARERTGMSQKTAAESLGWSQSKLVRIELGTVPVTPADVRALLSLYGVSDQGVITSLAALAKEAREGRGFSAYEDVYSAQAIDLFGNEPSAKAIYKYEPDFIPGLFQTEKYARALLRSLGFSESIVDRKLEVRIERQQIIDGDPRPELNFIIGEAAVSIPAGGDDVMVEQLERLRELAKKPGISIQLLPFAAGVHQGLGGAFTVLQFDDENLADLLYLENAERESLSRDEETEIRKYLSLFLDLQQHATTPEEFDPMLQRIAEQRFGAKATAAAKR